MKKYILVILTASALFLTACNNAESNEEASNGDTVTREEFEQQNEPGMADAPTEDRDFSTATEDVMEFISDNDKDIYVDGPHDYQIIEKYSTEKVTDQGLTYVVDGGYEKRFGVYLVENEFGNKMLAYGGHHINNTESEIEDYGGITFVTDTGEQVNNESGVFVENDLIGFFAPGVERKDITFVELDKQDEIPSEVKITLPGIYVNGEAEPTLFVDKTYTLTIDK